MKLWQKGGETNTDFERFTIGRDPELDIEIARYDVIASIAHVKMLGRIGLLSEQEVSSLVKGLDDIGKLIDNDKFVIEKGIEDCHSQIEMILTEKLGETGKKVHAGRSRNDQVITAMKLYSKDKIISIAGQINQLFDILINKSEVYRNVLMPGYTHMQVAMPSSFGLWFGAYAESLIDDLILLWAAYEITDANPLGSAAGYGASFPLDREYTTTEMGFAQLNVNSIYAQMTRGKMEKSVAFGISSLAATLSKYAMDICLYSGQNFDFFRIPEAYTTGSSIMPHKHNPDGFELVRGKCNALQALPHTLTMVLTNLPSGYHRDLQVLKEHFIPGLQSMSECLEVTSGMTEAMEVNPDVIQDPKYDLLFTVEEVNRLVIEGIPFRDAYKKVAGEIATGNYEANRDIRHVHLGSIGNPGNDKIKDRFKSVFNRFHK